MKNEKIGTSMAEDMDTIHELAKQFAIDAETAERITDASVYCAYRYDQQCKQDEANNSTKWGYFEFLHELKRQLIETKAFSETLPHQFEDVMDLHYEKTMAYEDDYCCPYCNANMEGRVISSDKSVGCCVEV